MKHLYFYILKTLISFLLLTQVAFSQTFTINAIVDCGIWIKARSENNSVALEHYALGFLNGMVFESSFDFWGKPYPISIEQSYLWLDKHCRENPLSQVNYGLLELFKERQSN